MTSSHSRPEYVLDTSVTLKWYVQRGEDDVTKAFQLLEAHGRGQCVLRAPDLLVWEVANALTLGRRLEPAEVWDALTHLRGLGLDLRSVQWSTLQSAVQIAAAADATVYDAYYLALALESGGVLVTADEKFVRKVRRYPRIVSLAQLQLPDFLP